MRKRQLRHVLFAIPLQCAQEPRINPFRLGFANEFVQTHFNFPYEAIFITEAQKYLNSRRSTSYPDWQSRWYEQHGHNYLDIFLDTQRPGLIDLNIRELSQFIEIVQMDILDYDRYGKPCAFRWKIRRIENNGLCDLYLASGKRDKSCYEEDEVISENRVFEMYDSRSCKPKFYKGHMLSDFDYDAAKPIDESFKGYSEYMDEYDDELPEGFYPNSKKKDGNK